MPYASALSEHPITAQAVGEVAGEVLERLGRGPDLAMLFLTPHHGGALEDAAGAVRALPPPGAPVRPAGGGVGGGRCRGGRRSPAPASAERSRTGPRSPCGPDGWGRCRRCGSAPS